MLTVGDQFPHFALGSVMPSSAIGDFPEVSNKTLEGAWSVVFFYPKDFTFVCPTEITGFNDLYEEFAKLKVKLFTVSTDSEFVHHAWIKSHPDLQKLKFPMLSDTRQELTKELGIFDHAAAAAKRATFIIDPKGIIRFVMVTDLGIGRNPAEVLRVIEALQSGKMTPCNWTPGQPTLN